MSDGTTPKYERTRRILDNDENKINRIINPYRKIRETINEMITNE